MRQILNYKTLATDVAPDPLMIKFWVDISADPNGGVIKTFKNGQWTPISGGNGSAINVVNNLTSTSTTDALSANMGRDINERLSTVTNQVTINTNDIESLKNDFNNEKHFLGYYQTNAEIQALTGPIGAYAWSVESGTVWQYDGTTWTDTTISVPDQSVPASDSLPLIDGIASSGNTNEYARGDHRHPSDTTKANISDVYTKIEVDNNFANLSNAVIFDNNNNVNLRPGTKITGSSSIDSTNHEVFGINSYTDTFGAFDQTEVGSQEALYNVNIQYDANRTLGHATADVYNPDGSYKGKEVFAYVSDVQNALIPHAKVVNQDLSNIGATGSLTYDGITGQVQNTDGTFLSMQFTSATEYNSVNIVRTIYATSGNSTQRVDNSAMGAAPISFPPLTIGANVRVEIDIIINDTGDIYHIIAGGPIDLSTCWGYVEKI